MIINIALKTGEKLEDRSECGPSTGLGAAM